MRLSLLKKKRMKEVIITINGDDIADRIFSESAYAALARAKGGLPERFTDILQTTDDDRAIIQGFIGEGINEAVGIINRFMSPCSAKFVDAGDNNRLIRITFTLPHNCPASSIEALKTTITNLVAYRSLQHWMLTVKPDEANLNASKADSELARMRSLLAVRERPKMNPDNKDNIIEL